MLTDAERRAAPGERIDRLRLKIFDLVLELRSDSEACISAVAGLLGHFVIGEETDPTQSWTSLTILTRPDNQYGCPVIITDGQADPLAPSARPDPPRMREFAYLVVCRTIAEKVRTHFLVHAAALSYRDQGVMLVGDPGYGKSTLALALVRRGCRFLSDEFAALGRDDGLLHPFPRSLQLHPDTLDRTGYAGIAHAAAPWLDKLALDVGWLGLGVIGDPVPLRHVVILRDPAENEGLLVKGPTFADAPRLLACSQSRAALETLKHYYYGGIPALLRDEYDGSSLRLYLDLISAIKGGAYYELLVGRLDREIDLLWDALGGD